MTECERIIAEGILPESFFEEEVRDGFLVTRERKKIWAIELDLLLKFDDICKKYNLKYFLNGGSALGAVRHHGFIPWDDDIDVEMPREDYEKLLDVSHEFTGQYFLQTPDTDPECCFSFTKLRNSNTSAIAFPFKNQKMNHGIFIDILPLDNWDKDAKDAFNRINELNLENSTYMRMTNPDLNEKDKMRVEQWKGRNPREVLAEIYELATQFNGIETPYIMVSVTTMYSMNRKLKDREDYASTAYMEYEGFKLPVPSGYDHILSGLYGDYMKFPPENQRGVWHSNILFDPDKPYSEYCGN